MASVRARDPAEGPRRRWTDVAGVALAAVIGAPSLGFAYGRDQALFHYVGREWLGGRWPYADVFDIKPPGIYAVHAASAAIFGDAMWPARLWDLVAVIGAGALAGRLVQRQDDGGSGLVGLGALLAVALHYGLLDFWHTGQVETWQGLAVMAAAWSALAIERPTRSGAGAGLAAAVAILFKLSAAAVVPSIALLVWMGARGSSRPGRALVGFAAGLLGPLALSFAVFAVFAWPGLADLAHFLPRYVTARPRELGEALAWILVDHAAVPVLLLAIAVAARLIWTGADRTRGLVPILVVLAGSVAAVVAQRKFFLYHWGAVFAPAVWLAVWALAPIVRRPGARLGAAVAVAVGLLAAAPPWASNPRVRYLAYAVDAARTGLDPRALADRFRGGGRFDFAAQVAIADAIRARQPRTDLERLHVRGFEHGVYLMTGLASPARIVNEDHLGVVDTPETRAWRVEHGRRLGTRPQFFVSFADRPDELARLRDLGYRRLAAHGLLVAFEHPARPRSVVYASRAPPPIAAPRCDVVASSRADRAPATEAPPPVRRLRRAQERLPRAR